MKLQPHNKLHIVSASAMLFASLAFSIVFFSSQPSDASTSETQFESVTDLINSNPTPTEQKNVEYRKQTDAFVGVDGANLGTPRDPRLIAAYIVRILLTLIGTLFVLYTIYGGYLMMRSQGDEEKMAKGREVIRTAVIGIIIILSAYSITLMVAWIVTGGGTTPLRDQYERDLDPGEIQLRGEIKENPEDFLQSDPFLR